MKYKCTERKTDVSKFFTIGKVYEISDNGNVFDDDGRKERKYGSAQKALEFLNHCYGFEPVKNESKILITAAGATTLARLYEGKEVIRTAEAKCAPCDTYDFKTGANLAYARLMNPEALSKPEPYAAPSEPSQPKLIVTRQMLVELGACQDGKELFDHCFPDDNAPFEAVMLIAKARGAGISAENWLIRNKSNIESMQSEQKKETVKLYCAKDYNPGRTLTKGKIYEFVDGIVTYDGGQKSHPMLNAKEFCEAVNATVGKTAIVSLEKRPAKVGEYVLVTENPSNDNHGDYRKGEIYKVQKIAGTGKFVNKKANAHNESISGMYQLLDNEYLVLDNYAPEEPKEEYWSGEIICIDDAGGAYTRGKKYTVKNGIVSQDNCTVSTIQFKSFEDINRVYTSKFIEFKGAI